MPTSSSTRTPCRWSGAVLQGVRLLASAPSPGRRRLQASEAPLPSLSAQGWHWRRQRALRHETNTRSTASPPQGGQCCRNTAKDAEAGVIPRPTSGGGSRRIGPVSRAWQQMFHTAAATAGSRARPTPTSRRRRVGVALGALCRDETEIAEMGVTRWLISSFFPLQVFALQPPCMPVSSARYLPP